MEQPTQLSVEQLLEMYNKTPQETDSQREQQQQSSSTEQNVESTESNTETKTVDQLLSEANGDKPGEQLNDNTNTTPQDEVLEETDLRSINLLIQEGKLFPMEDAQGNVLPIKTKQDLIELIDSNNEYFRQQAYTNVEEQIYKTKSPVWQTLLKYAEEARDISEIAPLFNTIQESYMEAQLDPSNPEHQEEIIRIHGSLQGLDEQTIIDDIQDLKERGKLEERATKLKPSLDNFNQQRIQQAIAQKEYEEQQKAAYLQNYYTSVLENVIKPETVGGLKLNEQHKQLVASTLVPDPELGGLPIYSIIDNLLQQGQFDILSKIALLATDPKSFDNYYSTKIDGNVAAALQKRLRTSHQNQAKSGSAYSNEGSQTQRKPESKPEMSPNGFFFSR